MKKEKLISSVLATVGVVMISIALSLESNTSLNKDEKIVTNFSEINIKNMATSTSAIIKNQQEKEDAETINEVSPTPINMEIAPASIIIPPRVEVYENMTIEELTDKLNRNLGSGYIAGKGYLIATHCIETGVDPYIAVAIMLHETGCKYNCSTLVRSCNNVGGQKGAPGCNGGSYKAYNTLDEGIIGFIDNLQRNYYSKGLTTVETIAPRYAQSSAWPAKINGYINQIRAN